jgi:ABC-type lipoprotein export system ATPase subunit
MAERTPLLQFKAASLVPPDQPASRFENVSLTLEAGAAAVVQTAFAADFHEEQFDYFPLADAAQGLLPCGPGQVLFDGRDWADMPPLEQARARGRIGRLFEFHGWVYNLSVLENLILAVQTHGRGDGQPEAEALAMARRFGLAAIPEGRPVTLRKRELRLFEWIRAFLGRPELIIVERPELDMPRLALSVCFDLAREARERGAAILLITHEVDIVERAVKTGASPYGVRGRTWHAGGVER